MEVQGSAVFSATEHLMMLFPWVRLLDIFMLT